MLHSILRQVVDIEGGDEHFKSLVLDEHLRNTWLGHKIIENARSRGENVVIEAFLRKFFVAASPEGFAAISGLVAKALLKE